MSKKIPAEELLAVCELSTPVKRPHIDALKIEMKPLPALASTLSKKGYTSISRKTFKKLERLIHENRPEKSNFIRGIIKELKICYDGINDKLHELGNSLFRSNDAIKIALYKGMGDVKEVMKRLEAIESSQKHSKITSEELIEAVLGERKVEPRTSKMGNDSNGRFDIVLSQAVRARTTLQFCRGAMSKDAIGGPKRKAIGLYRKAIDTLESNKYNENVTDDTIKEVLKNIDGLIEYEKTITKEIRPGNKGIKLTQFLKQAIKHLKIILKTKPGKAYPLDHKFHNTIV